jgi:ABC-type Mn2+/Zn2+ transport system ATPase subunit
MTQPLNAAISFDDVTVRFGSVVALDHITTRLQPGRSAALIGPNGSGKTTLLRLVAGLRAPTAGRVSVPVNAVIGYVSQHASQPAWLPLTGSDVVRMGRYRDRGLLGRLTGADDRMVVDAARRLDVEALLDRPYGDLSGGQRQRIRLAQALAQQPNVLALDEPITGLDLPSQQIILDLIDEETHRGTTVIITTHHLDEARHCDQVLMLSGRLVADGSPDDVLVPALLRATFGERLLGDHRDHDHAHAMLLVDDHAHNHTHNHGGDQ